MVHGKVAPILSRILHIDNRKMRLAYPGQKFQDWFTQQWAIFWGKRIEPEDVSWLMGPFGKPGAIADEGIENVTN
jgi:hypothetical protein